MKRHCRRYTHVSVETHDGGGCAHDVNDGGSRDHYHWSNHVMVIGPCGRDDILDERSVRHDDQNAALVRIYPLMGGSRVHELSGWCVST